MFDLDAFDYADAALAALTTRPEPSRPPRRDRLRSDGGSGSSPERRPAPAVCPFATERAA